MKNRILTALTFLVGWMAFTLTRVSRVRTNFALSLDEAQILDAIKGIRADIMPVVQKIQDDAKTIAGNSKEDRDALKALDGKYEGLLKDLDSEKQRSTELELKMGHLQGVPDKAAAGKSLGRTVLDSEEFKSYQKNRGAKMSLKLEGDGVKAVTGLTAGAGGNLLRPDRQPDVVGPILPTLRIRDLLTTATTTSNAVEFVRENVFTNNAASVAENGQKPESDMTFDLLTLPVRTVAHFIKVSKQILEDVGQLEAYLDGRMVDGLKDKEDIGLLTGDGTGQNLTGLLTSAALFTRGISGDTRLDAIRRGMTQVALAGMQAEGVVLNPVDWEAIELLKGTNGMYIWISVSEGGVPRLFRMPVAQSVAIAGGKFLLGAFKTGAILFDRQDAIVEIFEQDTDNVQKNMLTIRAEERLALACIRPKAFVQGNLVTV